MNEPLGIALELAAKRRAFAARLSPQARRLAFPYIHSVEVEHRREAKQSSVRVANCEMGKNPTAKKAALLAEPQATVIIDVCAAHWGVPAGQIYDAVRKAIYVRPRQAAMALMREMLGLSMPAVGILLRRDHTTIIYGLRTHDDRIETDADYRRRFDAAEAEVRALFNENAAVKSDTTAAAGGEVDAGTEPVSHPLPANMRRAA